MTWILDLFGDLVSAFGVPLPQRKNIDYEGAVSVVDDPVKKRTVVTVGGADVPGAFGALSGSSLSIGSNTPPQIQLVTESSGTITSGTVTAYSLPVASGACAGVDLTIELRVTLTTPGIQISSRIVACYELDVFGTGSAVQSTIDATRTTQVTAHSAIFGLCSFTGAFGSGAFVTTLSAISAPTWTTGATVTGSLLNSTTIPNAIGSPSCSLLATPGGNLYLYTAGGTTGMSAPTSTSSGAITDGTATCYYVGPAASGLTLAYTVTADLRNG